MMRQVMTNGQRVLLIAGMAGVDPRSVVRFLEGKPNRGAVLRARIEEAAKEVAKKHPPQETAEQQA
jgi:DNA-binding LacI/PurR family transcriptional regulator